jgi:predicted transcriptional regulator
MRIVLAEREAELMEALWEYGPSTVSEVRERIPSILAYTTVLTILRNLEAKGYVKHEEEGRAHRYAARIKREAAQSSALSDLAAKLFKGSSESVLLRLVADERLSPQQVRRIQQLLNKTSK